MCVFLINHTKYLERGAERVGRWLVTSVDTGQLMIVLLAMATGTIAAAGDERTRVTIRRQLADGVEYININRVYEAVTNLQDGAVSAWEGNSTWVVEERGMGVALFVLVFLLSGQDFLPCFYDLPFQSMWQALLKGLRVPGLFPKALLRFEGRSVAVDEDEGVKVFAVAFHYKRESSFSTNGTRAQAILDNQAGGDTATFVKWVRLLAWNMGGTEPRQLVPPEDALRYQVKQASAVSEYWMGGMADSMPHVDFNDRG